MLLRKAPENAGLVTHWADRVLDETGLQSALSIAPVNEKLYVLKHQRGKQEIYFFSNQDDQQGQVFTASFTSVNKTVWCWDPHTGERFMHPSQRQGKVDICLQPLESLVLVLDEQGAVKSVKPGESAGLVTPKEHSGLAVDNEWKLSFLPVRDKPFELKTGELFEFGIHKDPRISTFAGQVIYETTFDLSEIQWAFLDLGIEKHITQVKINGVDLGVKWWGRHLYPIEEGILQQGENQLQIIYTTTLANYANSLYENEVAKRWINLDQPDSMGLSGDVKLLK